MNTSERKRLTISLSPEEERLLSRRAKNAGMTSNQYVKRVALEDDGSNIEQRILVARTMAQLYRVTENMESIEDRRQVKAVANALWQFLK